MLLCGMGSSKGFRNWIAYHHQNCLCGELPIHIRCPSPGNSLVDFCCTSHCARAWFVCTRIFPQTLSMLGQQHFGGNLQSFCTSTQDSCTGIIPLIRKMSSLASGGRIGVCEHQEETMPPIWGSGAGR